MKKVLLILLMLSTQVGFAQWKLSTFESTSYINTVAFPSENAAYIAGAVGKLYKSTDQGATWTDIYDFGVFTQPEDMFFINADTGFVNIYGTQYRTIDGGVNWDYYGSFYRVKAVQDTLYASKLSNDTVTIQKSVDLGDTWTTLFEKYETKSQPYLFSVVDGMNAFFINPKEVDRVYKTTNGFSSIDTLFIRNGDMVLQKEFDYKDLEFGYHYGSRRSESHPTRTWSKGDFYYPIDLDGFGVLPVFDLDFKKGIMYASSLYGKIYSSTNNGLTWTEHRTPTEDPIYSISFYDKENGIAISENRIFYTNTGGEPLGFGKQSNWNSEISIYPNPTQNMLSIEYSGGADMLIEVYSASGVKVKTIISNTELTKIDLSNFANGVYFISFTSEGQKQTKKVVKR